MEDEEQEYEGEEDGDIEMAIPRNTILLKKLLQPKLVKLPNVRMYYARYQPVGTHSYTQQR